MMAIEKDHILTAAHGAALYVHVVVEDWNASNVDIIVTYSSVLYLPFPFTSVGGKPNGPVDNPLDRHYSDCAGCSPGESVRLFNRAGLGFHMLAGFVSSNLDPNSLLSLSSTRTCSSALWQLKQRD